MPKKQYRVNQVFGFVAKTKMCAVLSLLNFAHLYTLAKGKEGCLPEPGFPKQRNEVEFLLPPNLY